ncbi:hypothetical protein SAMD00023353_6900230 [Rosellinia necatrix]|uniref:Peptidase A2 domain-containing protein n=1 Tax=Rosellinia necatrix TaxID=77044 RepID=A0A1W2TT11_ROSNE|nr:hypothetical protein SAMD00023353_6900230 [Rosellinia necatrix]
MVSSETMPAARSKPKTTCIGGQPTRLRSETMCSVRTFLIGGCDTCRHRRLISRSEDSYEAHLIRRAIGDNLFYKFFLSLIDVSNLTHRPPQLPIQANEWMIDGKAMGKPITALPDSGADACFISLETAMLLGLNPKPGTDRTVKLANGTKVASPGAVDVPWNFLNEEETHNTACWILPRSPHQIILGSKFLEETKCLTTHRHRIKVKDVPASESFHVRRLGEGKQRLWGYIGGKPVAALPDTGSDVMIMSRDYAQRLGLKIERDEKDMVELGFADGTTALTDGTVRDITWACGGHSIRCDFLVLDNLNVDVILAKDYLFKMDVFSTCEAYLTNDYDGIYDLGVCGIRLVRMFRKALGAALERLEDDSIEDAPQDAFSQTMVNREWARRDRIRDEIELLDEGRRADAEAAEARRQEQWEAARADHRGRRARAQASSPPLASTTGGGRQVAAPRKSSGYP